MVNTRLAAVVPVGIILSTLLAASPAHAEGPADDVTAARSTTGFLLVNDSEVSFTRDPLSRHLENEFEAEPPTTLPAHGTARVEIINWFTDTGSDQVIYRSSEGLVVTLGLHKYGSSGSTCSLSGNLASSAHPLACVIAPMGDLTSITIDEAEITTGDITLNSGAFSLGLAATDNHRECNTHDVNAPPVCVGSEYRWALSGPGTDSVTLDPVSGKVSGSLPAGVYPWHVTLHAMNRVLTKDIIVTAEDIRIVTDLLPAGEWSTNYSTTLESNYPGLGVWSATGLPAGLWMDPRTAEISGVTLQTGRFPVTITLADDASTHEVILDLNILKPDTSRGNP